MTQASTLIWVKLKAWALATVSRQLAVAAERASVAGSHETRPDTTVR
jgi:hypothetical protein